jgi:hypothetical protein
MRSNTPKPTGFTLEDEVAAYRNQALAIDRFRQLNNLLDFEPGEFVPHAEDFPTLPGAAEVIAANDYYWEVIADRFQILCPCCAAEREVMN